VTAPVQRLLVVLAAFVLLGHGGLEVAPRLVAAAASSTASAVSPSVARPVSRPAAESQPVASLSTLRTALAVQAPPGSGDTAAGPGGTFAVAPHLVAQPVARPPAPPHVLGAGGGASGRAPPAPAGT
jgi:hypothetical protein